MRGRFARTGVFACMGLFVCMGVFACTGLFACPGARPPPHMPKGPLRQLEWSLSAQGGV